ncbi:MAG TPA: RNA methyltransferase [Myxococcota bacterium]|nr:RNA methyltransferase [Myxococcota bacterium]
MVDKPSLERFMLPERVRRLYAAAARRTRELTVVLDGVHDPHNLSAVVRSVEGFGLLDLHVIETHARFGICPKVTQGAEKWLDIHRYPAPQECLAVLQAQGFALWLADPDPAAVAIDKLPWEGRLALVFGNEHEGASDKMRSVAHGKFRIPMRGFSQSLNVSVAAGIVLATGTAERERRTGSPGDLTSEEQAALAAEWQRRSVRAAEQILARLECGQPEGGESLASSS